MSALLAQAQQMQQQLMAAQQRLANAEVQGKAGGGLVEVTAKGSGEVVAVKIDPKVVDPAHFFDGEITRYTDFIRQTKPVAGVERVLIPGDPERKTRAERTRNGIPLPDDTWAAIVNTAREVGVSEVSIQRATS